MICLCFVVVVYIVSVDFRVSSAVLVLCFCTMSFLRNLADSLANKVMRTVGVVPPYEVVETTAQQFAGFVTLDYNQLHQCVIFKKS